MMGATRGVLQLPTSISSAGVPPDALFRPTLACACATTLRDEVVVDNTIVIGETHSMSAKQQQENNTVYQPPDLIHLRLPAALLSSFKDSQLSLNIGNKKGTDERSISISQSGAKGTSKNIHPLQNDSRAQTQWYQASTSPSDPKKKQIVRIGATKNSYTISNPKQPKPDFDLKRIGEKTRKLLDQEKKKRKEIVCLKDDEFLPLAKEAATADVNAPKTDVAEKEKTKPAAAKSYKKRTGTKRKRNDPTIDGWMPNTDVLISQAIKREDRSNILRLHGLPIGTTPDHIRKFFHGLDPSNIFVLPTLNQHIEGWDVKDDTSKCTVTRHPNLFRVFVKFQSVLVADAAMERLGESIVFDSNSASVKRNGIVGAAVSMSPVPKHVASHLQKHLVSTLMR